MCNGESNLQYINVSAVVFLIAGDAYVVFIFNFLQIDMLPQIYEKVNGKCEIYIDGGIQKGSDVFKALALGANMVFMGRPFIWGLASSAEEGAKKIFQIVKKELDTTMCLAGVKNIEEIKKEIFVTNVPVTLKSKV